jgi:deoxyadenosine/deoxycytidine kinase
MFRGGWPAFPPPPEVSLSNVRHIAVEGAIGAGKTSLVHLLAADLGAQPVLEIVEENPFLVGGFYHDPERLAFDAQVFFLLSRVRQQREIKRRLGAGQGPVVTDYCFDKDNLYASLTLDSDDYALYRRVFRTFRAELPTPDLVLYLRASTPLLMSRIRVRDRVFERALGETFVDALNRAYEEYFASFSGPAHVTVDVSDLDWMRSPEAYAALREIVTQTIANIEAGQGSFDFARAGEEADLRRAASPH